MSDPSPRKPIIMSAKTKESKKMMTITKVDLQKFISIKCFVLFLRVVEHKYTSKKVKKTNINQHV